MKYNFFKTVMSDENGGISKVAAYNLFYKKTSDESLMIFRSRRKIFLIFYGFFKEFKFVARTKMK